MKNKIYRIAMLCGLLAANTPQLPAEAVGGMRTASGRVAALGSVEFQPIVFYRGRVATAVVVGDGDTDIDLYVYDNNGNLIAKDEDGTDRCVAVWTPAWTGAFKIVIVNRGKVYNNYEMATN